MRLLGAPGILVGSMFVAWGCGGAAGKVSGTAASGVTTASARFTEKERVCAKLRARYNAASLPSTRTHTLAAIYRHGCFNKETRVLPPPRRRRVRRISRGTRGRKKVATRRQVGDAPLSSRRWFHPLGKAIFPESPGSKHGARRGRRKKAQGCGKGHCGVDLYALTGTPVYAIASGRLLVAQNKSVSFSGKFVAIQHGPDRSIYCHLDRVAPGLSKGKAVRAGQLIGWVGRTGMKYSGAHLHLNVRYNGKYIDSEPKLRQASLR
jgi:murein DD-endopeptidase MepM/ murein hydrolase activator NlpD